ncbi:MAG: hypothetical protein GY772_12055 [bacterium]|nr:hypothetical protein [bacterium]
MTTFRRHPPVHLPAQPARRRAAAHALLGELLLASPRLLLASPQRWLLASPQWCVLASPQWRLLASLQWRLLASSQRCLLEFLHAEP